MSRIDVNELLDYAQDHIHIARDNDSEDQIVASCTRAILRLEQIRTAIAQDGFTEESDEDDSVKDGRFEVKKHILGRGDVSIVGGRQ